ncbi:uncharacterized protein LOC130645609 isoform X2 [Hydractinia symbiolongicarpus]|uniref:uncharacterized protein LOC130645609 isoform X2 n=1 Tax=Hydractinia symbiolongicarpus TaxID=13093 RepID=UPI00254F8265|nr:uncharacterized protein LOC130645609 isoform X2 [Hydractinia symbiolongicarpus]
MTTVRWHHLFVAFAAINLAVTHRVPTGESKETIDEHETRKHLQHVTTQYASSKEREQLIKDGLAGTADYLNYVVSSKPSLATKEFDCKIKKLAFEFAKKLAPGTGNQTEMKYIYDGLQLGSLCNVSYPSLQKMHEDWHTNKRISSDGIEIYVDDYYGQNHHDGSFVNPLKDIQSGLNKCKILRSSDNNGVKCTVFVRGGTYKIQETLKINEDNVILTNYGNEDVRVTSDAVVNIPKWNLYKSSLERFEMRNPIFEGIQPKQSTAAVIFVGVFDSYLQCDKFCANSSKCTAYAYFDTTAGAFSKQCYMRVDGMWDTVNHTGVVSGKKVTIYSADLSSANLKKVDQVFINGRRAVKARFPNANPETMGLHTIPTGYVESAEEWLPPLKKPAATEIHIEVPLREASLFPKFYIGVDGPVNQFDPPQSYWATKNPFGGGGSTYEVPSGLKYSSNLEMHLRSWKNPSTGIVHCYQNYHWGNWMYKLDSRDEENRTLHWSYGGFQEARGSPAGKEWYVENIFEELDSANEWFYDENSKVLYYSPNGTDGGLPSVVTIPQLPSLLTIIGNKHKPVKNVSAKGLKFQHTTQTFLESYMVPSGGDWSVHRNGAVYIQSSEGVTVQGCTFDSPGGNGLFVSNYNRETIISHNLFYRLGDNGIVLVGDSNLIDGTRTNQPRGVQVLYNLLFENGLWGKQTYPYVQSRACEIHLEGNVFFNGPRAGININDGFGGGNSINNNLLFNFVRETDDHGPINTWDRVPYLTRVYDGKSVSLNVKENQIHLNFIVNNYRSVWPIDHDDGSCFWNDTHNYLVYGGFKNYLGHDKHSMSNIYAYPKTSCAQSDGQTIGTSGYGDVYESNTCIIGRPNLYDLGSCKVGYLMELIPYFARNRYYTPNATIEVKCGDETWDLHQFQMHGMEIGTVVNHLVDDDVVIGWGKDLLGL